MIIHFLEFVIHVNQFYYFETYLSSTFAYCTTSSFSDYSTKIMQYLPFRMQIKVTWTLSRNNIWSDIRTKVPVSEASKSFTHKYILVAQQLTKDK